MEDMDMTAPTEPTEQDASSGDLLNVKKSLLFTESDWDRIQLAAKAIAEQTGGEPDVPGFVRGTLRRRCDDVLGAAA
jgi:hypothetical protein